VSVSIRTMCGSRLRNDEGQGERDKRSGYLTVTVFIAVVVFEKLGVDILRRAWINLDVIWAVALIATGTLTLML
jgi:hypothetical protein